MRRRSFWRVLFLLTAMVMVFGGTVGGLVLREPATYRAVVVPEANERRQLSGQFMSSINELMESIRGAEGRWYEILSADQMNSYFEEDFVRVKPFQLPDRVSSPRVQIEPNRLRLAFRYGKEFWSTIITLELNLWLVPREVNTVAIEILSVRAGSLPISIQSLLDDVSANARRWNIDVVWYRREGNPVAIARFQADLEHPTMLLQRLGLQDGRLLIAGRSSDVAPARAMIGMAPPSAE